MVPACCLTLLLVAVGLGAGCERNIEPECEAYVACQTAYVEATGVTPADTSTYSDPWSDCWGLDERTRDRCVAECLEAHIVLEGALAELDLDVPACDAGEGE